MKTLPSCDYVNTHRQCSSEKSVEESSSLYGSLHFCASQDLSILEYEAEWSAFFKVMTSWKSNRGAEGRQKEGEREIGRERERESKSRRWQKLRQRSVFIGLFLEATNVPLTLQGKILPQRFLQTIAQSRKEKKRKEEQSKKDCF